MVTACLTAFILIGGGYKSRGTLHHLGLASVQRHAVCTYPDRASNSTILSQHRQRYSLLCMSGIISCSAAPCPKSRCRVPALGSVVASLVQKRSFPHHAHLHCSSYPAVSLDFTTLFALYRSYTGRRGQCSADCTGKYTSHLAQLIHRLPASGRSAR